MKITEIRIDRTKSLGNYENIKLGFTATVAEDESESDAIERLTKFMDWHINLEERTAKYNKLSKLAEPTEADKKWLEMFEDRKADIN